MIFSRHRSRQDAQAIVGLFNAALAASRKPMFMPTIEAAVLAKHPWLIVLCRSCDTIIDLDVWMKPRPPMATILMAFAEIRCPRCNGHGRPAILRFPRYNAAAVPG
jgi:hypothetical protein